MNADSAFEILREANPVPDPARYHQLTTDGHTFLAATKERTLHMETIAPAPEKQELADRRRGPAIAIAVFVVVLVGVVLALGPLRQPAVVVAPIPEPPFTTPAEAAEAYLTVRYTGDYRQLEPLMNVDGRDDSLTFDSPGDAERLEMRFDWMQAFRGPYTDLECVEVTNVIAECTYATEWLDVARLTDDGAISVGQRFTIDTEGHLLSIGTEEPAFTEEWRAAVQAFGAWINERHPDLLAEEEAIFESGDYVARPAEEILADWNAAIDEYLAETG